VKPLLGIEFEKVGAASNLETSNKRRSRTPSLTSVLTFNTRFDLSRHSSNGSRRVAQWSVFSGPVSHLQSRSIETSFSSFSRLQAKAAKEKDPAAAKPKKEKAAKVEKAEKKDDTSVQQVILAYLVKQNRPYSPIDVFNNLGGE
jgi:hypothetical protein